ncbi:MAG: rhomboid family intramembrane serine protease [Deltaproteobacteria bacterium]|nr:rhomboid family intramembrane serine protease [Deltaproteobacteria bacterium]MBW1871777.1 rhomboid family intramembrane serine protease [Deltaproteobacteria bacterium]
MNNRRHGGHSSFSRFGFNIRLTKAVKWLLIVNVAVFLLELIIGRVDGGLDFIYYDLSISFDRFFFSGEIWQPVTYMFLHDPMGISHILWNMLMLWMFGSPLESFWRGKKFLQFYFICGVGAAAAILLVGFLVPSQRAIPTLGASGALYALLVAFGFMFPNTLIYLFGLFPIKGKHLVMLFIGLGVVQSLTLSSANVSLAAHFGGMLMGFLLVTGFWKPAKLIGKLKLWWMKRRYRKLKQKFRVIDKDDGDDSGYMH